jgi:hypothetical protein
MYDWVMVKIQALWNAVSRSQKQNDIVDETASKTFIQPTCTRWCSEYYAVERVVEIGLEKIVSCRLALGQAKMTEAEMKVLNTYLFIMKPVVKAMKLLERESDCYLGMLIPTIMGVQNKLHTHCGPVMKPFVNTLKSGLQKTFGQVLQNCDYRIASMLHLKFKLAFLPNDEKIQMKEMLISYVKHVQREVNDGTGSAGQPSTSSSQSQQASDSEHTDQDDLFSYLSHKTEADTTVADDVLLILLIY